MGGWGYWIFLKGSSSSPFANWDVLPSCRLRPLSTQPIDEHLFTPTHIHPRPDEPRKRRPATDHALKNTIDLLITCAPNGKPPTEQLRLRQQEGSCTLPPMSARYAPCVHTIDSGLDYRPRSRPLMKTTGCYRVRRIHFGNIQQSSNLDICSSAVHQRLLSDSGVISSR